MWLSVITFYSLFLHLVAGAGPIYPTRAYNIPPTAQDGPSSMDTLSSQSPLDGHKLDVVDANSYETWYFDVVSNDSEAVFMVTFTIGTNYAFGFANTTTTGEKIVHASMRGLFPNGTFFLYSLPAEGARITTVGEGSSGDFIGTGCKWAGSPDLATYILSFDIPSLEIKGGATFNSVSGPLKPKEIGLSKLEA